MCTLALAWQVFSSAPVAVAANRDEVLDRPADPPARFADDPRVVAPRDDEAGGTWIGCNEHGVFVGITNRWMDASLDGERSRGLLVADALSSRSAAAAVDLVETECDRRSYGGFYLVVADATDAYVLGYAGRLDRRRLDPGVHVVTNVGPVDAPACPSDRIGDARTQLDQGRRVRGALEPRAIPEPSTSTRRAASDTSSRRAEDETSPASNAAGRSTTAERSTTGADGSDGGVVDWLDRAEAVLSDHEYGVCRHGDGFGTRSSSLIALGDRPTYRYAPGPPCRTAYESVALESHI